MLCLLLTAAAGAQAGQGLSLPEALATAFANNPQLAAAGREIGIADGERRQAGLMPNPELSWEVEDTRRDTSTTTVTLSQTLELGGKRGARIAVAGSGQVLAQLDLERQRNGLRADVVQAFHTALRMQAALELAQQSQALTERGLRVVQGRVTAGQSSPVEAPALRSNWPRRRLKCVALKLSRGWHTRHWRSLLAARSRRSPGCRPPRYPLVLRLPTRPCSTSLSRPPNGAWPLHRSSAAKPP